MPRPIVMQYSESDVSSKVFKVLNEMLEEWGTEPDEPLNLTSTLVGDAGFSSIDFVQFAVAVEKAFDTKLGFQALLMQDGAYVDDLNIKQVVTFIQKQLNKEGGVVALSTRTPNNEQVVPGGVENKLTEGAFAEFKKIIKPCDLLPKPIEKNPSMVFVLSPPRSGSTLLRIMLAGSPQLFVPPELHLLTYADMSERHEALDNEHNHHLLEGAVRALMQLKGWTADEARLFASECETKKMSCKDFYSLLQSEIGTNLLVDKTPTYAISKNVLVRAEDSFDNAKYIHLLRHPCGTIRSYEESKLTRMMPLMRKSSFSTRMLAEMTWLICHQSILDFTKNIPSERIQKIKYEDLVKQPKAEIRSICAFLEIDYHPDMLDPYQDNKRRMADGVEVASKMSGDLKFHLHQGIDEDAADRWKQFCSEGDLGDITKETARSIGYGM